MLKKLTKVTIFIMVFSIISTGCAFALFVINQFKPPPAPVNLMITGFALFCAGHMNSLRSRK